MKKEPDASIWFSILVIFITLFILFAMFCINERINILEAKIEWSVKEYSDISDNINKTLELNRRILEQNTALITEIHIDKE